jgi:hypothetical protein
LKPRAKKQENSFSTLSFEKNNEKKEKNCTEMSFPQILNDHRFGSPSVSFFLYRPFVCGFLIPFLHCDSFQPTESKASDTSDKPNTGRKSQQQHTRTIEL